MKPNPAAAIVMFLCAALSLCGCKAAPAHDTVLMPGQSVAASNRFGDVRIVYAGPTTRRFEFDGQSRTVHMTQRSEMFDRRFGIYDPADSRGLSGSVRIVCEESIINFDDLNQLYQFLRENSEFYDWVYTTDGLAVGFSRVPERSQIDISLYQFLVRGQKPHGLQNARPSLIHLGTRLQ